jgi:beta-lactamase regulating signal transducer with metallopeptidase domain
LTLAFRKNRAQVRYWLWFSASLKFLIPFSLLLTLGNYLGRSRAATGSLAVPAITYTVVQIAEPFPQSPPPAPPTRSHGDWLPIAAVGFWACGFAGIALMRLQAWLRIRAALRSSLPLDIPFPVEVRSSPPLLEPGVVGFFRPMLLLPTGIVERLTPSQLQAVLWHELFHIRRRDNLTAAVHMIVEAAFWFHPLAWWISARLMEERERACDEGVLELGSEPQVYAESILKTCQFCVESPLTCVSGVTGADLKKRVVRIMTQVGRTKLTFSRKLLLASFALAAVLGPLVLGLKVTPQVWAQNS